MEGFNFNDLQLVNVEDIYVVTYNNKIITLDGKTTFSSIVYAKNRLEKVLIANYHQGHYWHKSKDNTFTKEGGHMRNGGTMSGLDVVFKNLGKLLSKELLNDGVFVIKKIQ